MSSEPDPEEPFRTGYRALLALPGPRRLVLAAIPADLADWLDYAAVLALLVFAWGEGPFVLALFAFALSLPYVVIGPFLAMIVDRSAIRPVLVISNLGRALATLGLVLAGDTAMVLALVFVRSTIDSAFTPARQAAIQSTTPKPLLQAANGLHHAINQTSKIVGPAVGGLLLAAIPAQAVFGVNAVLSLIAAGIAMTVTVERRASPESGDPERFIRRALAGIAEFGRKRMLRLALIFTVTAYFAFFLYDALLALLTDELGLDATAFGLSIAASGGGGLIGSLIAGRATRQRPLALMAFSALVGGVVTIVLGTVALAGWSVALVPFLLALALMGGATGFMTVPYRTVIQTETPEDRIARVYAAGESVTVAIMLAAPFIGSLIAQQFGTGSAFISGGALLLILGLATALSRDARRSGQAGSG